MNIYSIPIKLLDGYDISTNGFVTPYMSVEDAMSFCFQIVVQSGSSPTGTFYVSGSAQDKQPIFFAMDVMDGVSITDNGQVMINLQGIGFKWVQLSYVRVSGTGNATVFFNKKILGN